MTMGTVAVQVAHSTTQTATIQTTKMLAVASMDIDSVNIDHLSKQQSLQLEAIQSPSLEEGPSEEDLKLATQLSHLASQHHASEYNVVKFGNRGSPLTYIPLSIQLPSHVRDLRRQQIEKTEKLSSWWITTASHFRDLSNGSSHKSPYHHGAHIRPNKRPAAEAAQEILIEESVTSTSPTVATVVFPPPPIIIPTLKEELTRAMASSAIPSSQPNSSITGLHLKTSKSHPINISPLIPAELLPLISAHLQPSSLSVATVFDLPPSMTLDRLTLPPSRTALLGQGRDGKVPSIIWNPSGGKIEEGLTSTVFQPPSPPPFPPPPPHVAPLLPYPAPFPIPLLPLSSFSPTQSPSVPPVPRLPPSYSRAPPPTPSFSHFPHFPPPIIGNLLLSSCPGKKVRLTGPVKGRGAICRDLKSDLERIKDMGVGCIVCCLDDDELEFLGAEWPKYRDICESVGIDVLRIPMPEGLSPPSIAPFNYHLDTLIQRYTLRSIPVLVHCRGGVGRAGLVACCWMIKVGLCGFPPAEDLDERESTLDLVQKAIVVIRRRRSVKAIETFEQVRFLVDFVEFLRGSTRSGT